MNLIRAAFSTPKRLFIFPLCAIAIQQLSTTANCTSKYADSVFNYWRDLMKNPTDWWDYREDKSYGSLKPNSPDFKHKTNGSALWLNSAPNWVLEGLEGLDVGRTSKEDSWKSLLETPDKWWDNRHRKTNAKAPDFIHKETGEGLWLNSAPKWVLTLLEGLEMRMGKKEDCWKNFVGNPDKWCDHRPRKTNLKAPDFIHRDTGQGLWLDSAPKWVWPGLEGVSLGKTNKEDSWKNLVEDPDKWLDNRPRKLK